MTTEPFASGQKISLATGVPLTPADPSKINPGTVYDLKHSFEDLHNRFLAEAQARKIKLSLFIEQDLPAAFWDISRLHTYVFSNFLTRSLSHTPDEGTASIRVEKSSNHALSVKISHSGPEARRILFKHDEKHFDELDSALLCILAHKGTISMVNDDDSSCASYVIELPLYALCVK